MTPFQPFRQLVEDYCGLEFSGVAAQRLEKEISKNSDRLGLTLPDYFSLISENRDALIELVNQLTVNETYFYREPEQIALFVRELLPRLRTLASGRPLRILSVGCSSGEEPYTLVMAISEHWGRALLESVQIDAGDLDEDILEKARAGVYSPFSFRALDDGLRDKYFQPTRRGYRINDEIRQAVRFFPFNLKAAAYPVEPKSYDAIFFRNVSIYFSLATRKVIQGKLKNLLRDDAVLLLGSSETLGNDFGMLELLEAHGQYYFAQGAALPALAEPSSVTHVSPAKPAPADQPPSPGILNHVVPAGITMPTARPHKGSADKGDASQPDTETRLKQFKEQLADTAQHRDILLRLEKIPQSDPAHATAQLMQAWVLLNKKRFERARALLEQVLAQSPWSLDALIALGLCQKWQGVAEEALQSFKKACYSHPESWLAHYYLADIQKQLGLTAAALNSFQTVRRILSNNLQAPSACAWLPLALPAKDVLFLAERNLLALKRQPEGSMGGA